MSATSMLAQMRKALGWGEPNAIHRWYAIRNGPEFGRASTPWCQMTITWAAFFSGNYAAVCPNGDRAYTVSSAEDGRNLGRWHAGTASNIKAHARPGAVVFFDWDGTDTISRIDHVGVVERNLGDGRVQTIEGNTRDACKRRVRAANVIAGFWNPAYSSKGDDDMPTAKEVADEVYKRFTGTVTKDVWAARQGILDVGQELDPRTALRQIWAYGKDGYNKQREILAKLEAHDATIRALVEALAAKDGAVDVEALVDRIRQEIAGIRIRLDTGTPDS